MARIFEHPEAEGQKIHRRIGRHAGQLGGQIRRHPRGELGAALAVRDRQDLTNGVFVVDGSAFPTASEKNPTLTILALSWRASDYLADEKRKGNLG